MHFVHAGAGRPALLFVHGFGCDHDDWSEQLAFFGASHEVAACDLRGHGKTPGRAHECTIAHYGGDVAALAANFELAGAILVGHSMGCRVVLEAARLDPERFAGVVLIDGSRLAAKDPERARMDACERMADDVFMRRFFEQMFFHPIPRREAMLERAMRLPKDVRMALFGDLAAWDAAKMDEALAALRVPLLVIQSTFVDAHGRHSLPADGTSPYLELLRARPRRVDVQVVSGPGHFVQLEAAEAVNRLLSEFAARAR